MPGAEVGIAVAFLAGVASVVSPCVLALIPAYMSYLSGLSLSELTTAPEAGGRFRSRVLGGAFLFVLGFTLVFVAFGATATALGRTLVAYQDLLRRLAGIFVMLFGISMTGLVRIPVLEHERRVDMSRLPRGPLGAFPVGMAFAAGWTPCVGPALASILFLAGAQQTLWQGVLLLLVYSLGMGLPFLAMALLIGRFRRWLPRLSRHSRWISLASGALIAGVGVMLYTNAFFRLAGLFNYYSWGL
ncbi:MAG TPA: cytochrome c biogenesis protein CcdA [Limnochorda sp.]